LLLADAYDKLGDFESAITYYLKAYEIDLATEHVSNQLCWDYGLLGKADLALPYCEQAVKEEPAPSTRDSRGLAYALLGKFDPAIADFQVVVDELKSSTKPEEKKIYQTRQAWIKTMQNGDNPITPEELARLRKDSASEIAIPTLTASEKVPLSGLVLKKAAAKEGFTQFNQATVEGKNIHSGSYINGSCVAMIGWREDEQRVVYSTLIMAPGCEDSEQQGLAFWLVDLIFPDKSDKAKAFIWSFTDLYDVIEGKKTATGKETIGGFVLSADRDKDSISLRMIITSE
jgi:tetratricopeptide (TPR) repeat protein